MAAEPSAAETRAAAARVVSQTIDRGRSLDEQLAASRESGAARGLKHSLCYGTLRWHFRLAAVLRALCDQPPERLAPELRALLEVGLFQLMSGEVAEHAAVAETVEAARALGFAKASGFVNAVLRRFQRERATVLDAVDTDLAVRTAHPRWFVDALGRECPDARDAILEANNAHPPMWLRVNRMRTDVAACETALRARGWDVHRHPFAPDALRIAPPVDVHSLPGFDEGLVSVQDAAPQLAVELLVPQPGERILDACAAPGGKTCHLLERVSGLADVTALDISPDRLERVRENLGRLGLSARVEVGDIGDHRWWDGQLFDRVLLDVPCSATGVIRRHPDIKVLRRARDIPVLARRQANLLQSAWGLLKPGGTLLYTTCSALRAEGEDVVAGFLSRTSDAADGTGERCRGWPPGPAGTGSGYRVHAGQADMDGFYYACLTRRP